MKRNRLLTLLVGACLTLVLLVVPIMSACGTQGETPGETPGTTPGTTTTTPTGERTVSIGILGSFTGVYAPYGVPMRDSVINAVKMFNDAGGFEVGGQTYKVELVQYDDRTDPKRSVAGLTWMADMYDIKMISGAPTSPCQLACQPIADTRHIIMNSGAAATAITRPGVKWVWSYADTQQNRGKATASFYTQTLGAKKVAVLTQNYASWLDLRTGFVEKCKELGPQVVELVADEMFETETTDFSTIIARLRNVNPDIVYIGASPAPGTLIVKQIYESGWHVLITSSTDVISSDLFRVAGKAANEIMGIGGISYFGYKQGKVPDSVNKAMGVDVNWYMEVSNSYIQTYGDQTATFGVGGYSVLNAFVEAMKRAGTVEDIEKIRDTYEGMEFSDPTGLRKILPCHRWNSYMPISVYWESDKDDKFDILAVATHTDDWQQNWEATIIKPYETIPEIRARRGY